VNLLPDKKFYDGNFVAFLGVVCALLWPRRASFVVGKWGTLSWTSTPAHLASFALMLFLACGWIIVMQQHASIHGHFLPRMFAGVILWGYALVAHCVSFAPAEAEAPVPAPATTG